MTENNTTKAQFPKHKDHLNKTFLEELGYKTWSTKCARFNASKRLNVIASLSNLSLAMLSCYLIVISLLTAFNIVTETKVVTILTLATTALSILFLVLSQIENAKDYRLRAHKFHHCALLIGSLNNEVRMFKTIGTHTEAEKEVFCKDVEKRYQAILNDNENHDSIDHDTFKLQFSEYFELTRGQRWGTRFKKYYRTKLIYHIYIGAPVIIWCIYLLVTNGK